MTAREGISAMLAGDYRESIEHFSSALSTLRDNGQRLTYSRVVHYRGLSWLCLGEHGAAWDDLDAELQIVAASGDGRAEAHACEALAQLELDRCRPTDALAHAQRGLSLAAGSGDAVLHADLLLISGLIAHLGGALEEAAARYDDAEAVALTNLPPSHAALLGLLRAALGAERGQPVDLTMPSDGFALGDDLIGVAARLRGEKNEADAERTSRPPHVLARLADRAVTRALQSRQTS